MPVVLLPESTALELVTLLEADGTAHPLDGAEGVSVLVGRHGFGAPPVTLALQDVPFQQGARLNQATLRPRPIDLPLFIAGTSLSQTRQRLRTVAQWLNPLRGDATLRYLAPDGTTRQLPVRYQSGLEVSELMDGGDSSIGHFQAVVGLLAPDPYWYDLSPTLQTFTTSSPKEAFLDPPVLPLRLSGSTVLATGVVTNPGDAEAYPVWTITGPGTDPALLNRSTGQSLVFALTLLAGDVLTVDTRPQRPNPAAAPVLKNGGNVYDTLVTAQLWPLQSGANDLRLEMGNATGASSVMLSYTARWQAA